MKNFFLVGMPGSGKSTTAKYISEHTDLNFIDLDVEIEKNFGKKINEIFSDKGEKYFRNKETNVLKKIVEKNNNFILATGGGTPCFNDTATTEIYT